MKSSRLPTGQLASRYWLPSTYFWLSRASGQPICRALGVTGVPYRGALHMSYRVPYRGVTSGVPYRSVTGVPYNHVLRGCVTYMCYRGALHKCSMSAFITSCVPGVHFTHV